MSSSYTELRYFRGQDQTIGSLHPDLAQQISQRLDLQPPDKSGDSLLLALCQEDDPGAFLCLRCHVSHALEHKSRDLAKQFSPSGLQLHEIAGFALLDDGDRRRREPLSYLTLRQLDEDAVLPFSAQVICSYDPERGAGLPHWAKFRLNSYKPLQEYLRDFYGLKIISDWALLKDSSATRMREAWPLMGAWRLQSQGEQADRAFTLEHILVLHERYCSAYTKDREEHVRRHRRRGGYVPSSQLLLSIQPDLNPRETYDILRSMATAIRRYLSPGWHKQLTLSSGNDNDGHPVDPIEVLPDSSTLAGADDLATTQLQQIRQALERALDHYMPAVLAKAAGDPLSLCLWRGFADGLNTKEIAARCGCSGPKVSRILQSQKHAINMAWKAAAELGRLSAFGAVVASPEGAERMVKALKDQLAPKTAQKQLPSPAQEGDESLPTLQQWVQRHLPPS